MDTVSTKSRRKQELAGAKKAGEIVNADHPTEFSRRTWLIASAAVMFVAAFLRLYDLTLVPLHHDEGVNGNFLVTLVRNGIYHYDPTNYHGPTLYFFSAIIPWVARVLGGKPFGDAYGLTTFNIRLVTALAGIGTVWLVLHLRRRIGSIGALSAAGLLAISPGAVYLSRYFIHETLFVFFALGMIVALLKYYDDERGGYLILAGAAAVALIAIMPRAVSPIRGTLFVLALGMVVAALKYYEKEGLIYLILVAIAAAAQIAIAISAASISQTFVYQTLFVFLALGMILAVLQYFDKERGGYLLLAAVSAALMTATKETWIINGPVIFLAYLSTTVYFWLRGRDRKPLVLVPLGPAILAFRMGYWFIAFLFFLLFCLLFAFMERQRIANNLQRLGGAGRVAKLALLAIVIFIVVNVLFYSSFLTNYPKGVNDALLTLSLWSGRTQEHVHSAFQYLEWLREEESPLLIVSIVGAAIAVWRADNRFALFVAQWAFGSLAAYSLVGYKTPWIALNFVVPMAITAGYVLDVLYRKFEEPMIPLALSIGAIAFLGYEINLRYNLYLLIPLVLALAYLVGTFYFWTRASANQGRVHFYLTAAAVIVVCSAQMFALNFVNYDDDRYTYVYAHTRRDLVAMVDQVNHIAARSGQGADTGVTVVSPDYWPLPWYFRDLKRVGYFGRINPSTEAVVIASTAQEAEVHATFDERYTQIRNPVTDNGSYALRPGVDLLLFVRRDLAR